VNWPVKSRVDRTCVVLFVGKQGLQRFFFLILSECIGASGPLLSLGLQPACFFAKKGFCSFPCGRDGRAPSRWIRVPAYFGHGRSLKRMFKDTSDKKKQLIKTNSESVFLSRGQTQSGTKSTTKYCLCENLEVENTGWHGFRLVRRHVCINKKLWGFFPALSIKSALQAGRCRSKFYFNKSTRATAACMTGRNGEIRTSMPIFPCTSINSKNGDMRRRFGSSASAR